MKASCLQENLNKGLSTVGRVVSTKNQLPVLGNILFAAEDGRLRLSATNLEIGTNFWVGAKIEEEGQLMLPARALTELVASLPSGRVDLEASSDLLKLSCAGHRVSLNGLPSGDFPVLPQFTEKKKTPLPTALLSEAISQVVFAAAQDEGRPVLAGVKWAPEKEGLALAATDGYRLSLKKISLKSDSFTGDIIIPARALLEVTHLASGEGKGEEAGVFFVADDSQVNFSFPEVEITSRLIEGDFPDFSKIIPQSFTTRVTLDREVLLKAARVAAVFARDSANIVRWKIEKGKLTLSANSPQVGENVSELEAKTEGEEGEIAFNFRFLLDFLGAVKSEEIIFEMSGPLNPGVFKIAGDDSFLHIIMPVRVQG